MVRVTSSCPSLLLATTSSSLRSACATSAARTVTGGQSGRKEAELRKEADEMLKEVQTYVEDIA